MNTIESLFEQLTHEIEAALSRIDELNNRQKTLDEYALQLDIKKAALDQETEANRKQQLDLESQKAFVTKQGEEIQKREILTTVLDHKREEIQHREDAVRIKEKQILLKEADLEKLTVQETKLDNRETLLKKVAAANLVREETLAIKEAAIRSEAKRLQNLAESWEKIRQG